MTIGFTKMHGLGNDFIVIDNMNGRITLSPEQIVLVCDRHKGVGADGVILVEKSDQGDCFMNYYNSDGTLAEMCGNGVRCVAKFFKEEILPKNNTQTNFKIDTRAGVKEIEHQNDDIFSVNMGQPVFIHKDFPDQSLDIQGLSLNFVSVGNPHAVVFVKDINDYELGVIGPLIENNSNFPNKINLEIAEESVSEKGKNEFTVKVWERGCGATLACGTGACAVYAIARKYQNADAEIIINLPGGKLFMSENKEGEIIMRGPAVSVFSGLVEII